MTALRCISAATKATKTCRLPRKMLLAIETKEFFKCQGGLLTNTNKYSKPVTQAKNIVHGSSRNRRFAFYTDVSRKIRTDVPFCRTWMNFVESSSENFTGWSPMCAASRADCCRCSRLSVITAPLKKTTTDV